MAVENSVKDLRKERKETQKDLAMNEKQSLIAGNKNVTYKIIIARSCLLLSN